MSYQDTVTNKIELIHNTPLFHYDFSWKKKFLMDSSYLEKEICLETISSLNQRVDDEYLSFKASHKDTC